MRPRYPTVPRREAAREQPRTEGVYASLDELARLEHKARGFTFLPRQPVHSLLTGRHASRVRGRGLDFDEIRRYLPGDDPRTIDWKITQRTGAAHVRVYTEERDRPALLLVDQRLNMFFGTRRAMKSVVAAELAALVAWRVFDQGDRVGGHVFSDTEVREIKPHRSRRRVLQLLGEVVELNHRLRADLEIDDDPGRFNRVLEKVARTLKHDALVVVISDFFGADDDTRRLLTRMAAHNDVVCAVLYDPIKTSIPPIGKVVVSRGELQLELDTGRGRQMEALGRYFSDELREIQTLLRQVGIPALLIDTQDDPVDQIRAQLGAVAGARR